MPEDTQKPAAKKKRTAAPGTRHRRDNGPQELEVVEAPPLTARDVGHATNFLQTVIADGPDATMAAQREAARLAKRFGEEFESQWLLMTDFLRRLRVTNRTGAHVVRYALQWRPRFLACVAMTRSPIMGARAAKVSPQTVQAHRKADPDFEAQYLAAETHATQLLLDRAFSLALEGNCEPVFWQGIRVGHVRKFDSKLIVEVLRAHAPATFKQPGQANVKVNVNGHGTTVLLADRDTLNELQAQRQEALKDMADQLRLMPPATSVVHDV